MFYQVNGSRSVASVINDAQNSSFHNISFASGDSEVTMTGDGSVKLSPALLISFTVCLALLVTVGLLGNTVVIFALIRTRAHRATTTNAYILNLSIADLLFLIFCVPFQGTVYILNDWPFRQFMCKAAHFCQYCTMYASIWVLTIMSIDRYMAIGHPLKSVDWRSPGQAMRICCYVWVVAAIISIPWWVLYRTAEITNRSITVTACFDYWTEDMYEYRKWLFLIVFLTGFVIPSIIIFCMSLLVARSIRNAVGEPLLVANERRTLNSSSALRRSNSNGGNIISKRRRRVVWLVFGLALTFFLCWLPQNASSMWLNFHRDIVASVTRHYKIYFIIKVASHMLTYVNSSINPILYSLASGRFRSRLAQALFIRRAGSFNNRGTASRPRSTVGNKNSATTNGATGGAAADSRSTCSSIGGGGGGGRGNGFLFSGTIYASTTNYSGTEEDLATNSVSCGYYNRASPRMATNQLQVPGSLSPKNRNPPRWLETERMELYSVPILNVTSADEEVSIVIRPPSEQDHFAAKNRNRSLTWSTAVTPGCVAENSCETVLGDAHESVETKEKAGLVKRSGKGKRLFQWRKRR